MIMTTATATRNEARRARVERVRTGAPVRRALGQSALYRQEPDGQHFINWRGQVYAAASVEGALELAGGATG